MADFLMIPFLWMLQGICSVISCAARLMWWVFKFMFWLTFVICFWNTMVLAVHIFLWILSKLAKEEPPHLHFGRNMALFTNWS